MHARIRQRLLPATLTTKLSASEKKRVEKLAQERGLTPSEYARKAVLDSLDLSAGHRLILAEVCAMRKEVEALLSVISDLNERDVERARSSADLLRPALVQERLLEMNQAESRVADA